MDAMRMAGMFATLSGLMTDDPAEKVEREASIFFKTPGIFRPDDWDELTLEEKQRRMDGAKKIALEK